MQHQGALDGIFDVGAIARSGFICQGMTGTASLNQQP